MISEGFFESPRPEFPEETEWKKIERERKKKETNKKGEWGNFEGGREEAIFSLTDFRDSKCRSKLIKGT